MLSVDIHGRKALPIRALPFLTNGYWKAGAVSLFIYDPNRWPSPFDTFLCPQRVLQDGSIRNISGPDFMPMLEAMHAAEKSEDPTACISALYPGVFIWHDVAQELFNCDIDPMSAFANSSWPDGQPKQWNELPIIPSDLRKLVREGFESFKAPSAREQKSSRCGEGGTNIGWKKDAVEIARTIKSAGKRVTKNSVAKQLKMQTGSTLSLGTIEREIRASWWS